MSQLDYQINPVFVKNAKKLANFCVR